MLTNSVQPAAEEAAQERAALEAATLERQPTRLWNKNYLLLWQGQFVSRLGNQAFDLAMALWIVQLTGSAAIMGLLVAVSNIPTLLLSPVGGVLADRHSRKRIIVLSDLLSGLAVLALAAGAYLAADMIEIQLALVFAVSIVLSVIGSFFGPAISAAIPDLVPKDRLAGANSMGQLSMQLSLFIGSALSGTAFRLLGAPLLFLINGLTFLFSAASESLITIPQRLNAQHSRWQDRFAAFKRDLAAGFRYVWSNSGLRAMVLISAVGNFFSAPFIILMQFYVKDYLGVAIDWVGFLASAFGVGAMIGFVVVGMLPLTGRARARMLLGVMFADSITYGLLVFAPGPFAAMGLVVLAGATSAIITVNITTLVQMSTPQEMRGRVFGLLSTIAGSITPVAYGLSGIVADLLDRNIPLIYLVCAGIMFFLAIVIAFNRNIRTFLAYEPPSAAG